MANFIQNIQGIRVIPSNALKTSGLFSGPVYWPRGYAFGGWVYNSTLRLGFSKQPTELVLSIVLEASAKHQSGHNLAPAKFDISKNLLRNSLTAHGATWYGDENALGHFYYIDMHGVRLKRMYLHDYSISIDANQKVLNVTLKDYSLILNKIYIGLIKRQGPAKGMVGLPNTSIQNGDMQEAIASVTIEGFCPNCYLLGRENLGGKWGSNFANFFNIEKGKIYRKLTLGSYAVVYGKPNGRGLSSLRRWDSNNPRIKADQACYNTRVQDSGAACAGVYPQYINIFAMGEQLHQHPLRRNGRAWRPKDEHYCDAPASCSVATCGDDNDETCNNATACGSAGGFWDVQQTDKTTCQSDGHKWINDANLMPKEYWGDLTERVDKGERAPKGYTIDGGYLMIGTEMFSDSPCADLPDINYNFTELLDSLIFHGLRIQKKTDVGLRGVSYDVDKNPKFRANYIGTLREVLEQWCGAMGLDFYWDNTRQRFNFIDLEQGADLRPIQNIPDPATAEGREFGATQDGKSVIISYKESSSMANTHIQRVITSNTKPYTKREKTKDVQRYTPMLPLHPLDFTVPNKSITNYTSVYGEAFSSYRYANILPWTPRLARGAARRRPWAEPHIPFWHEARKRIWYTNRQLWDIDYAMTLSKYNRSLREMYVGQRIVETCKSTRLGIEYDRSNGAVIGHKAGVIHPEIQKDFMGNCMALGFIPIAEIIHPETKSILIGHHMQGDSDDVQDVNKDQTFYKLFIGYYTKEEHEDIVGWEQRSAEQMYKNGAVIQGTLPSYPFIPNDFHGLKAGERGFDPAGEGLSIPKLEHSFSPSADTYAQCPTCLEMHDAPFNSVLIRSGNFLPTGLRFAQLDNPWGTNVEGFEIDFNRTFNDNACVKYNSSLNIAEDMSDMYEYKTQTWDLDAFVPKFFDDLSESWQDMDDVFLRLYDNHALIDEVTVAGLDINTKFRRTCKKIHLMIVTDVANHENIRFDVRSTPGIVNQMSRKALELWQIKEHQRKAREEYRDRCDVDIHYEFCENAIKDNAKAQAQYGNAFGSRQLMECAVSPTGVYKEGFARNLVGGSPVITPFGVIAHPGHVNSRGLNIRLTRNPNRNTKYPRTDDLGYYYLADLEEDLQTLPTKTFNYTIVYPINNYKMYSPYSWWPGTEPFTEPVPYNNMDPTLRLNGFTFWAPFQSPFFPGGLGNHALGLGNFQTYNGIWNAKVTLEDRIPEITEIYGEPMNTGPLKGNPTTSIKVINNTIDPDLSASLDPQNNEFITKIYDAHGDEITTIQDWHNHIVDGIPGGRGLNNYDVREPTSQIDFKLAGSVRQFPSFIANGYAHPRHGLTSYNVSLSEAGLQTDMTFASRPPIAPELEAILNKIGPRIM